MIWYHSTECWPANDEIKCSNLLSELSYKSPWFIHKNLFSSVYMFSLRIIICVESGDHYTWGVSPRVSRKHLRFVRCPLGYSLTWSNSAVVCVWYLQTLPLKNIWHDNMIPWCEQEICDACSILSTWPSKQFAVNHSTVVSESVIVKPFLQIDIMTISWWMPQGLTDDMSALVQVTALSHYLSQCWPSSISPYGVTRLQRV